METLPIPSVPEVVDHVNGDLSVVTTDRHGHRYETLVTKSYGGNIVNPSSATAEKIFFGEGMPGEIETEGFTVLMPMQANGKCGANCIDCPFASQNHPGVKANQIDPDTAVHVLETTLKEWNARRQSKLGSSGIGFGVSFVMAGDAGFNTKMDEVLYSIAEYEGVNRIRMSTIAAKNSEGRNPLKAFIHAVKRSKSSDSKANKVKWRLQVSIHNTDEDERRNYVNGVAHDSKETLNLKVYGLEEIATTFDELVRMTGRKGVLAFTCNGKTTIDPEELIRSGLTPYSTSISLRDTRKDDARASRWGVMPRKVFSTIYLSLRSPREIDHIMYPPFDTVIMHSSQEGGELKRHIDGTKTDIETTLVS